MNCPDDEALELFADGELDDALWAEVERHIDMCEACRERFMVIRHADAAAREALAALKASAPPLVLAPVRTKARLLSTPLAVAAAAAVVIAVVTGALWTVHRARLLAEKPAPSVKSVATATPGAPLPARYIESPALTAEVIPLIPNSDEYAKRAAEARRLAVLPVDNLPEWKVDELRRMVAMRHGFVPGHDG